MKAKDLLESLLASGKEIAEKGRDYAEKKIGIPESGEDREKVLSGLGTGAVAGGLLALLLGTKSGRRLAKPLVKYGSLAALGGVAYTAYQTWQQSADASESTTKPIGELAGIEQETRSSILVRAMISAAKSDGHIDGDERQAIHQQIEHLNIDNSVADMLKTEIDKPLDAKELAGLVESPAIAAEVYVVSLAVIDVDQLQERNYLEDLAAALNLPGDLVAQLEAEALDR